MKTRRETLEEFVALDQNDSFSRYALALEFEKEGGIDDAALQLREVISRDPAYVAAYHQLGRLLSQTGFVEEARETYRRGVEAALVSGDQRARSEMQEALEMLE